MFYWDYVVGVLIVSLILGLTMGSTGGPDAMLANLGRADGSNIVYALAGGTVFNIANLLLVAAISIAGLAVAFPVGIGMALIVGVLLNYVIAPAGNPLLLFGGVALVLAAIMVDALAYRARGDDKQPMSARGLKLAIACGILMGVFYPLVTKSIAGARRTWTLFGVVRLLAGRVSVVVPVQHLSDAPAYHRRPALPFRAIWRRVAGHAFGRALSAGRSGAWA